MTIKNWNSKMNFSDINDTLMDQSGYFSQLDQNNTYKLTAVTFSIVTSLCILPLLYAVIRYERYGSDKKRTLINKLVSSVFWCVIGFHLLVHSLYTLRFIVGPLPSAVCLFAFLIKRSLSSAVLIFLNAIIATRYVFIFWLQNPAAFNDDFWHFFIKGEMFKYLFCHK